MTTPEEVEALAHMRSLYGKHRWAERVQRPDTEKNHGGGKWVPTGIDRDTWEAIKAATLEGRLGTAAKVRDDYTTACVYTADYADEADLVRVLKELRRMGVHDFITYKRDKDTCRFYGRGAAYWWSPPGTIRLLVPKNSLGRQADLEELTEEN